MGRMSLGSVSGRPEKVARRFLVYGQPGVGKTTLVADAPNPIFLPVEQGVDEFDVPRFPKPETYTEVLEAIDTLTREKHTYETFVIDTVSALEGLGHAHMIAGSKWKTVETWEGGYNKWRQSAVDLIWRPLAVRLDELRAKGVSIVLVGHSVVRGWKDPESDGWDKYQVQLEPLAAGMLTGWSDAVLFARFDDMRAASGEKKAVGVSSGKRYLATEHSAAYEAKNRLGLPTRLEMPRVHPWAPLQAAIDALLPVSLRAELEVLMAQMPEDVAKRAAEAARQPGKLRAVVEHARTLVSKEGV